MNDAGRASIVLLIREGVLDAELAALLWLLAEGGLPVHVAASSAVRGRRVADGLADVAGEVGLLTGDSLEHVLAAYRGDPARLGIVVVAGAERIVAGHYLRPPLRDGAGHLREQGPAVLVTWDVGLGSFEHFAWGVLPELAARIDRRPGDLELEQDRRREFLDGLSSAGVTDSTALRTALAGYRSTVEEAHHH